MPKSTFEMIKDIIVSDYGTDPALITREASFIEDLGFDSLDTIDLIMGLENKFNISISETDLDEGKDSTVGKMCDIVDACLAKNK